MIQIFALLHLDLFFADLDQFQDRDGQGLAGLKVLESPTVAL
jgi:hypothetical protein